MIPPILVSAPAETPVTREEAKRYCRVTGIAEDETFDALISAATASLDGWPGTLGRCLVTQTWAQGYPCWRDVLRLPFPDVDAGSVVITYRDAHGEMQTVDAALYEVLAGVRGGEVHFRDAFDSPGLDSDRAYPVTVTFDAGYGAAADVPSDLRQLIKMMVGHWYWNRETAITGATVADTPLTYEFVVQRYRVVGL